MTTNINKADILTADWSKQTTKALVKEFERKNQNPEFDFLFNDNFACGLEKRVWNVLIILLVGLEKRVWNVLNNRAGIGLEETRESLEALLLHIPCTKHLIFLSQIAVTVSVLHSFHGSFF